MTPAEHYAHAEGALAEVMAGIEMMKADGADVDVSVPLALAQVHATLATVNTATWHVEDRPKRAVRP